MADRFFRYFKAIADNNMISKNKWLIMWFLAGNMAAGGMQEFRFWNYIPKSEPVAKTVVVAPVAKPTTSRVIITNDCKAECASARKEHERDWHGGK